LTAGQIPGSFAANRLQTTGVKEQELDMGQSIQSATTIQTYSISACSSRRAVVLISLMFSCFALSPPAQAQLPKIFAADNPTGSLSSGGANLACLQNTTGSDVTLILDGNTITTKANRVNVFDKSSGVWSRKVILNQQAQPVSSISTSSPTNNTFLSGLYAYYKLDETSNSPAYDAVHGRTLSQYKASIGSAPGIISTSRYFAGYPSFVSPSFTDFAPGANHFFATFWTKAATLSYSYDASFLGRYSLPAAEWLVWFNNVTHKIRFSVSANGNTATTVDSTTALSNTSSWYFVAVGWDGANIKVSVNGEPYATASFAGPVYHGGGSNFVIGSENGSNPWYGEIDEVAIWIGRNDLSISEVQQLYNHGAGLPLGSFQ
jgi:Concanavalin A-like lectin/glucanases superfamily